jgi:hydrophobic/amphiphilic exporter-1 (mainly G- bacteria), HAE1 family
MYRLTEIALRNKSIVLLLSLALFLSGVMAWGSLQQELLPNIELPFVTVIAALPGAGAEDVAQQVTVPVEAAIKSVPRLENLSSTSANSLSLVVAQFEYGTNIKDTRAAIEAAVGSSVLPEGVTPRVSAVNINDQPVIVAAVGPAPGADPAEAAAIARSELLPLIKVIPGVSSADLTGGSTTHLVITLDPQKMADAGISLQQVQGVLQANQLTIPAGSLTDGQTTLPVTASHHYASVAELQGQVLIGQPTTPGAVPSPVTLGQIATVLPVEVNASGYSRTNGQPSLTLLVNKNAGGNTVDVADQTEAAIAAVVAKHPDSIAVDTISNTANFIKESRDGLVREGLTGAFFAVLTIFLFLLSLRSTLVAAVSIPLSIMAALALMGIGGLTINIITLGGLAVAVGRVVDDAIVVLENIYRHRARGDEIGSAVSSGTREVAGAITSSTITTVAVFLPLGFVGGIVSQFFLPFALTVTFALLASLIVALTVIPVLAYFFVGKVNIKVDEDGELPETIWQRLYTPALKLSLRSRTTRWATLGGAMLLFVLSLSLVSQIPTQFLDTGSEAILAVTVAPPAGASSGAVLERTKQVEDLLLADPTVTLVQTSIPGAGDTGAQTLQAAFQGRSGNSARMTVRLVAGTDLDAKTKELLATLAPAEEGGFDIAVGPGQSFGGGGGLSIVVSGDDPASIKAANGAILAALAAEPDVVNVKSDLSAAAPAVLVAVDPNKAIGLGSTTAQIAADVRNVLVGQQLGSIAVADGGVVPVTLKVDSSTATSIEGLKTMPVGTVARAPLGTVADVSQVDAQGSVTRVDGAPAATISGDIVTDDEGSVTKSVTALIQDLEASGAVPAGVTVELAGVSQQQSQAFGSLFLSMGVAILLVYIVMVFLFGSLVDPLVILFSLPLATIGAFPALLISGQPIGISALIGFLMLIGIVVTNAIVLLDLVEQLRHKGYSTYDALIQGGRTRVRPILMTAVATILALLPLALGFSKGSVIAAELGTVVIGGLFSSTVLTLVIVPVVYSLVDGGKQAAARRFGGGTSAAPIASATGFGQAE